ncbi:MAG TPA: hypothetical protein VM243_09850, partial [Phycisphaerae bacterium]|nr:hypothetical protein [Phycisphaerae bacterium]
MPNTGDTKVVGGKTYRWDGTQWVLAAATPFPETNIVTVTPPEGGTATMPVDTYFDIQERERAAGV